MMSEVVRMRKNVLKKISCNKGFTLGETLLAVLIMLMVSSIMATGIPAARTAYEKVVLASNAEVALSTAITSLRNELGMAKDININSKEIGYVNANRGSYSKIYVVDGSKDGIMIQRYAKNDLIGNKSLEDEAMQLVSKSASTRDLYVTYDGVSYDNGIVVFSGLSVKRVTDDSVLTEREKLSIRVFG